MYDSALASVLWYSSWPVFIFISYKLIRITIKYFEKKRIS